MSFRSLQLGILLLGLFLLLPVQSQTVFINEVMPNAGQSEGFNDAFVELRGPAGTDIGCWLLSNSKWAIRFPAGTVIPPSELFLIACSEELGVSGIGTTGDYPGGPVSGLACDICDFPGIPIDFDLCDAGNAPFYDGTAAGFNLAPDEGFVNTGDQVALFNPSGTIVDAAKWGGGSGGNLTNNPYTLGQGGEVPTVPNAGCTEAEFVMPALSDPIYVPIGGTPNSCNSGYAREALPLGQLIAASDNPNLVDEQWDFTNHPTPLNANDAIVWELFVSIGNGPLIPVEAASNSICDPSDITFEAHIYNFQNVQPEQMDLSGNAGSWAYDPLSDSFEDWTVNQNASGNSTTIFEYSVNAADFIDFGSYTFQFQWDDFTNEEGSGNFPGSIVYNNCYERESFTVTYVEPLIGPNAVTCPDDFTPGTINMGTIISGGFNLSYELLENGSVTSVNQTGIFPLPGSLENPITINVIDNSNCSNVLEIGISEECTAPTICPEEMIPNLVTDDGDNTFCVGESFSLCFEGTDLPPGGAVQWFYNNQSESDTSNAIFLGVSPIPSSSFDPNEEITFLWDYNGLACPEANGNNELPPPNGTVNNPIYGTTTAPTRAGLNVDFFGTFCGNTGICADGGQDRAMNSNTWLATNPTEAANDDMYYEHCIQISEECDLVITNVSFDISHSSGGPNNVALSLNGLPIPPFVVGVSQNLAETCQNISYTANEPAGAGEEFCFRLYAWKSDGNVTPTGTLRMDNFEVTATPLCGETGGGFTGELECYTHTFVEEDLLCEQGGAFQFWGVLSPFGENCPEDGTDLNNPISAPIDFFVSCPEVVFSEENLEICNTDLPANLAFQINGGEGGPYQVSYAVNGSEADGGEVTVSGSTGTIPISNIAGLSEYTIYSITGAGCTHTFDDPFTTSVNVLSPPEASFGELTYNGCGESSTLEVNFSPDDSGPWFFYYEINGEKFINLAFENPFLLDLTQNGSYQLAQVLNADCNGTVDPSFISVENPSNPVLEDIPTETVFLAEGESYELTVDDFNPEVNFGTLGGDYEWFVVNPNDPAFNPFIHGVEDDGAPFGTQTSITETTTFFVTYTDVTGCIAVEELTIIIEEISCAVPIAGAPLPPNITFYCFEDFLPVPIIASDGNEPNGGVEPTDYFYVIFDENGLVYASSDNGAFEVSEAGVYAVYGLAYTQGADLDITEGITLGELQSNLNAAGICFDFSDTFYEIEFSFDTAPAINVEPTIDPFCQEGQLNLNDLITGEDGFEINWIVPPGLLPLTDGSIVNLETVEEDDYPLFVEVINDCGPSEAMFNITVENCTVEGCTQVCALNFDPDAEVDNGTCQFPPCDDGCTLTTDTLNLTTCDCVFLEPMVEDTCDLTIDSFDFDNCQIINEEPDCDDGNPNTVDTFDPINCECVNNPPLYFDLAFTKTTVTNGPFAPGDLVTFEMTVINQGTADAFNIGLVDYMPAGLILQDADWTTDGSGVASLNTPIAFIEAGEEASVEITFVIDPLNTEPVLVNGGEISFADDDLDPNSPQLFDIDSSPDDIDGNDAGGIPNSAADDAIDGDGTGVPGDGEPVTDEDDADPALITVEITIVGCTAPCANNYDPDAVEDDGSCVFPLCDDACALTTDTLNLTTCDCVFLDPEIELVDDGCDLTVDSFDPVNCEIINVEPDVNDGCDLTIDSFDPVTCQIINAEPSCDDNNETTADVFLVDSCECINDDIIITGCTEICATNYDATANQDDGSCIFPLCDDACALTTDTLNLTTCDCVFLDPEIEVVDDGCDLTVDSFDPVTCQIINEEPSCDDNDVNTIDSFVTINCECLNQPVAINCTPLDASISIADGATFCTSELPLNLNLFVTGDLGGIWFVDGASIEFSIFDNATPANYELWYVVNPPIGDDPECEADTTIVSIDLYESPNAGDDGGFPICFNPPFNTLLDLDQFLTVDSTSGNWIAISPNATPLLDGNVFDPGGTGATGNVAYGFVVESANAFCENDTAFVLIDELICDFSGCTNPCALNYNDAATTDDGSCILPDCDDNCLLTMDSLILATCECFYTYPDIDDACNLTVDSFDTLNCIIINMPIPVSDSCDLTTDVIDMVLCEAISLPPDCNDNDCATEDFFDDSICECVNTINVNCNDGCDLTEDTYDPNTCDCIFTDPVPDDACPLTVDTFDAVLCEIINTPPDCDDNDPDTQDAFVIDSCMCVNEPIVINCTDLDANIESLPFVCESELPFDLNDLILGNTGGLWSEDNPTNTISNLFNPSGNGPFVLFYTLTPPNTDPDSCPDVSSTIIVEIEAAPNAGSDGLGSICNIGLDAATTLSLDGLLSSAETGTWSAQTAGAPEINANNEINGLGLVEGTIYEYIFIVEGGNACLTDTAFFDITISACVEPCTELNASLATPNTFCTATDIDLDLNNFVTGDTGGSWTINDAPITNLIDLSTPNTYELVYTVFPPDTDPAGCLPATDMITLVVADLADAGMDIPIALCFDEALNSTANLDELLTVPPSINGSWLVPAGAPALNGNNEIDVFGVGPLGELEYVYVVTGDPGCGGNDTMILTINVLSCDFFCTDLEASVEPNVELCQNLGTLDLSEFITGNLDGLWFLGTDTIESFPGDSVGTFELDYVVFPPATDSSFCDAVTGTMMLNIIENPALTVQDSVCVDASGMFDLSTVDLIDEWFFDPILTLPIIGADLMASPGIYYGLVTDPPCNDEVLTFLVFPPLAPTPPINQDTLCVSSFDLTFLPTIDLWFTDPGLDSLYTETIAGPGVYYPVNTNGVCLSPPGEPLVIPEPIDIVYVEEITCDLGDYTTQIVITGGLENYTFSGNVIDNNSNNPTSASSGDTLTFVFDNSESNYFLQIENGMCGTNIENFILPNCDCGINVTDAVILNGTTCFGSTFLADDLSFTAEYTSGVVEDYTIVFVITDLANGLIYNDNVDGVLELENSSGIPLPAGEYCLQAIGYLTEGGIDLSGNVLITGLTDGNGQTVAEGACIDASPCFPITVYPVGLPPVLNNICHDTSTGPFDLNTIAEIDLWYGQANYVDPISGIDLFINADATVQVYGTSIDTNLCESLPVAIEISPIPTVSAIDPICVEVNDTYDLSTSNLASQWFTDSALTQEILVGDQVVTILSDTTFYGLLIDPITNCESAAIPLTFSLGSTPTLPFTEVCLSVGEDLDLGGIDGIDAWFTDSTLLNPVPNLIVGPNIYYGTSGNGTCGGEAVALMVNATPELFVNTLCLDSELYTAEVIITNPMDGEYDLSGSAIDGANPNQMNDSDTLILTLSSLNPDYTLVFEPTNAMGCDAEFVIFSPACNCPGTAILTPENPLCNGGDSLILATLTTTTTEAGSWAINPNGAINPPQITDGILYAENADEGIYSLIYTLDFPPNAVCPDTAVQMVSIVESAYAGEPDASIPLLCQNDVIILSLFESLENEDIGGTWSEITTTPSVGGFDPVAATFTPLNQEPKNYVFQYVVTSTGTCPNDTAVVEFEVREFTAIVLEPTQTICNNESTLNEINFEGLITEGSVLGIWSDENLSGATQIAPTIYDFTNVLEGDYDFLYTLNNQSPCPDQMQVLTITVETCEDCVPPMAPLIIEDTLFFCFGENNEQAFFANIDEDLDMNWSDGTDIVETGTSFVPTEPGIYFGQSFVLDNENCLSDSTTAVYLLEAEGFEVMLDSEDEIIPQGASTELITMVSPEGDYTFEWSEQEEGLSNYNIANPEASPTQSTVYTLTVTDQNGCSETVSIEIFVEEGPWLNIPTAFSPNFDNVNDYFRPVHNGVEEISYQLFNRWGDLLYETNNVNDQGWDGVWQGEPMEVGVYMYQMEYRFIDDAEVHQERGNFTLIR